MHLMGERRLNCLMRLLMVNKIIIAGGRDFNNYLLLKDKVEKYLSLLGSNIQIVSGTASGADHLGEQFAKEKGYDLKLFPANWKTYGKSAGYLRNKQMAEYADYLIAFWDGKSKGTRHMIDLAKKNGLSVRVVRY